VVYLLSVAGKHFFCTFLLKQPANNRMHRYLFLLTVFVITASTIIGQHNNVVYFENINTEKGLSQNSVYAIAEDNFGYMWFATQDGLNRYNGKEMVTYYARQGKSNALNSGYIRCLLFEKTENILWVGTTEGLFAYHTIQDTFYSIANLLEPAKKWHLHSRSIKEIFSGVNNSIWVATESDGLFELSAKRQTVFQHPYAANSTEPLIKIHNINGNSIAASTTSLFLFNSKKNTFETIRQLQNKKFENIHCLLSNKNKLYIGTDYNGLYIITNLFSTKPEIKNYNTAVPGIGAMAIDKKQHLWLGTRGAGIEILDDSLKLLAKNSTPGQLNALQSNFILSIYVDRQGLNWVGQSAGGVGKYDELLQQFNYTNIRDKNSKTLNDNMVFAINKYDEHTFYYGTLTAGLVKHDIKSNQLTSYAVTNATNVADNAVYNIATGNKNDLWIANYAGLLNFNCATNLFTPYINSSIKNSQAILHVHKIKNTDSLLVSGDNGTSFFSLTSKSFTPLKQNGSLNFATNVIVRHSVENELSKNELWLGTSGEALVKYNYSTGEYSTYPDIRNISRNVRYILQHQGKLLLATDNGIIVFNPVTNHIVQHVKLLNNYSNVCYAILPFNNEYWVSTNNGLYKCSNNFNEIKNYNINNGVPFLEFNTSSTWQQKDGKLFFGGVGGIVNFYPDKIINNPFCPTPLITHLLITNKQNHQIPLTGQSEIALHYKENFLSIHFVSLNHSSPDKVTYYYKMEGVDADWKSNGNLNFATYTQLNPGSYTFFVKCKNSDGAGSITSATLKIIIAPPFWGTVWFKSLMLALLLAIIYFIYLNRIKKIKRQNENKQKALELKNEEQAKSFNAILKGQEEERSRIAKDLHDGLGGLLSGTKLSLSNLKDVLPLNIELNEKFNKSIGQIDTSISELRKIAHNLMPEALEKFGLENVIKDYCNTLQISSGIPIYFEALGLQRRLSNTVSLYIYRIIQELVNNAVKYSKAKSINAQLTITENKIFITVEDDGIGFEKNKLYNTEGLGFKSIQQRTEFLKGKIEVDTTLHKGTSINIELYG
jgi:signal transduction histidine kinase/ligand-binding sensor domain-containing protein